MIPDGPIHTNIATDVIVATQNYMRVHGITRSQLADAVGVSAATISNLFNEFQSSTLYTPQSKISQGTRDKLVRDLNNWAELDNAKRTATRPKGFVHTLAATKLLNAARTVAQDGVMGVVYGPAGVGKTTTIEYLPHELPGVMIVTVDIDCQSGSGMVRTLAPIAGLRRSATKVRLAHVVEALRGSGRLLVIDEAHLLRTDSVFLALKSLHDQAKIPILFVGTPDIAERLDRDHDPLYGQLSSRVQHWINLAEVIHGHTDGGRRRQWVTAEQLRRIFSHKLKLHPDAMRDLLAIANWEIGGLRLAGGIIRAMTRLANARGTDEPLTRDDLKRCERRTRKSQSVGLDLMGELDVAEAAEVAAG